MRTGHNSLNAHMYNKLKVGVSGTCPCNVDIMAAEHLLQQCQLHHAVRRGQVARTETTEEQALRQPGGAKADSRFCEGIRHLRLVYEEEEELRHVNLLQCLFSVLVPFLALVTH